MEAQAGAEKVEQMRKGDRERTEERETHEMDGGRRPVLAQQDQAGQAGSEHHEPPRGQEGTDAFTQVARGEGEEEIVIWHGTPIVVPRSFPIPEGQVVEDGRSREEERRTAEEDYKAGPCPGFSPHPKV